MNCDMFKELAFDYVGGGLDADSLDSFRRHYGGCIECAGLLRVIEAQETMLTALPKPKAPPTLWGRVQGAIGDGEKLEWLDRPRSRAGGWFAAAAALLVAAVLFAFAVSPGAPPARADLSIRVVDVTPKSGAVGRLVPGFDSPEPAVPVFDALLGHRD